ncbi:ovochymase-1 isoform X2 [Eurytemora carolleeae]|uniref:ovochymase-1 isoform X2 n=1 Tax=Eurytemora carolleeae TaxID=1294199 RepID=UPI000C79267E|nr:ovochymase-1 isoform X2 [Eurytemora carolleeae]|eukprot:XP_023324690.1 ovochymase-1-like isoform X2 [Eurytemora affinis]
MLFILLLLFTSSCFGGWFLFDNHAPALLPTVATPRGVGGEGGGGPDHHSTAPACGVRFRNAMLGRGNSQDLDSDTEFGEYPWHAAILTNKPTGQPGEYICGGAVLDGSHIVTAAHCVKSLFPEELTVRVGDWDASADIELYEHGSLPVSDIFIHERFYPGSLQNDIAIIRLLHEIDWNTYPHVSPICLPSYPPPAGSKCWVTGWGKDAFLQKGEYQAILQEVDVNIVDPLVCETALRHAGLGTRFKMHHGWLCAGGEAGKDACSGDGGGPLVCEKENQNGAVLAGLVSWGVGCGEQGVPGVYTNILSYVNWIQETLSLQ